MGGHEKRNADTASAGPTREPTGGPLTVAHLIYGYLGAGKTTFAKQLEQRHRAVRYSPDEWLVALYGHDPPAERFAEFSERVSGVIDEQWPRVVARGVDVVLDFGFWSRSARDAARRLASKAGAGTRLYYLTCAEATARERCRRRNHSGDGSLFITENTFEVLKPRFEPLASDEPFELVDSSREGAG